MSTEYWVLNVLNVNVGPACQQTILETWSKHHLDQKRICSIRHHASALINRSRLKMCGFGWTTSRCSISLSWVGLDGKNQLLVSTTALEFIFPTIDKNCRTVPPKTERKKSNRKDTGTFGLSWQHVTALWIVLSGSHGICPSHLIAFVNIGYRRHLRASFRFTFPRPMLLAPEGQVGWIVTSRAKGVYTWCV